MNIFARSARENTMEITMQKTVLIIGLLTLMVVGPFDGQAIAQDSDSGDKEDWIFIGIIDTEDGIMWLWLNVKTGDSILLPAGQLPWEDMPYSAEIDFHKSN